MVLGENDLQQVGHGFKDKSSGEEKKKIHLMGKDKLWPFSCAISHQANKITSAPEKSLGK